MKPLRAAARFFSRGPLLEVKDAALRDAQNPLSKGCRQRLKPEGPGGTVAPLPNPVPCRQVSNGSAANSEYLGSVAESRRHISWFPTAAAASCSGPPGLVEEYHANDSAAASTVRWKNSTLAAVVR